MESPQRQKPRVKKVALAQKVALTTRYPINVRKLSSDHCVVNTGH